MTALQPVEYLANLGIIMVKEALGYVADISPISSYSQLFQQLFWKPPGLAVSIDQHHGHNC